jgi:Flp pilus assembly protein TadD
LSIRRGIQATPDGDHGRLYLAWAELESRAGKRRKAAAHARVAWMRMMAERRPPAELLRAAELATDLWLRENQPQVAMAIGREIAARLRFHPRAWTIRATTQLSGNRAAEARESAEQALDLDDGDPRAHQLHGHALLRFGLKDRAREAYLRALELAEGTPTEAQVRADLQRL